MSWSRQFRSALWLPVRICSVYDPPNALADSDFEKQLAGGGREALERLKAFNADVIAADLVMPRGDAFELLRSRRSPVCVSLRCERDGMQTAATE